MKNKEALPVLPRMPKLIPTNSVKVDMTYNLVDPQLQMQIQKVNHLQNILARERKKLVLLLKLFHARNKKRKMQENGGKHLHIQSPPSYLQSLFNVKNEKRKIYKIAPCALLSNDMEKIFEPPSKKW
jgi:hypothetical protein